MIFFFINHVLKKNWKKFIKNQYRKSYFKISAPKAISPFISIKNMKLYDPYLCLIELRS